MELIIRGATAITEINLYVIEEARVLDAKLKENKLRGRLFCVPVLLKDNIDTFETHSTSGSLSLLGNQPVKDAALVEKLRKEGAIILGKASMDEFAGGVSGISGRNGRTGNVYNTDNIAKKLKDKYPEKNERSLNIMAGKETVKLSLENIILPMWIYKIINPTSLKLGKEIEFIA